MPTSKRTLPLPSNVPGVSEEAFDRLFAIVDRHLPKVKRMGRPRHFDNRAVLWLTLHHLFGGIDCSDIALREGVSTRSVQEWVARCIDLLEHYVRPVLPNGTTITSSRQVLEWISAHGNEALVDATELGVERARDPENPGKSYSKAQKEYFSGKAHTHTMKAQVLSDNNANLLDVSDLVGGAIHDYTLLKSTRWCRLLKDCVVGVDKAYLGMERTHHDVRIPYKRPKGGKLTAAEIRWNKQQSAWRVFVEHAVLKLKQLKILRRVKLRRRRLNALVHLAFVLITYRQAWP
jgi:hypothetical protein